MILGFIWGKDFLKLPRNFESLVGIEKYRALTQAYELDFQSNLQERSHALLQSFYLASFNEVDIFNRYSDGRPIRHLFGEVFDDLIQFIKIDEIAAIQIEKVFYLEDQERSFLNRLRNIKPPKSLSECLEDDVLLDKYHNYVDAFRVDDESFSKFMGLFKNIYKPINNRRMVFAQIHEEVDNLIKEVQHESFSCEVSQSLISRLTKVKEASFLLYSLKASFSFFTHPQPRKHKFFQPNAVIFLTIYAHLVKQALDLTPQYETAEIL